MNTPATSSQPILEMSHATITSLKDPGVLIVEEANWRVNQGDYWAVIGLHGSGKTDFITAAAGLMQPQKGIHRLFGQEMTPGYEDAHLPERLRVGLVFDGGQLLRNLTVAENIALPLQYHFNFSRSEAMEKINPWLNELELSLWQDSKPSSIGRKWQQRVGLARALVLQPEILLLDNPLSGLDRQHLSWWLSFLDQLWKGHSLMQNRPTTLVIMAEGLAELRNHAQQFALLQNKKLIVIGDRNQLDQNQNSDLNM